MPKIAMNKVATAEGPPKIATCEGPPPELTKKDSFGPGVVGETKVVVVVVLFVLFLGILNIV